MKKLFKEGDCVHIVDDESENRAWFIDQVLGYTDYHYRIVNRFGEGALVEEASLVRAKMIVCPICLGDKGRFGVGRNWYLFEGRPFTPCRFCRGVGQVPDCARCGNKTYITTEDGGAFCPECNQDGIVK